MNAIDLLVATGSLMSGIRILAEGLAELDRGRRQLGLAGGGKQFRGDGTTPRGKVEKVGNRVEERISRIRDLVNKGATHPKIRSFAVRVVSARCAKCPGCGVPIVLTSAGRGEAICRGAVRASMVNDSTWRCPRCRKAYSIAKTKWCIQEKDARREVEAVFNAVRANIRYVRDVESVDTFQHAKRTLSWGGGDCDDYTIVLGSLLKSIGYPVRARVMETKDAQTGQRAGGWSHILLLCGLPPRQPSAWLPLDASVNRPAGWYPPKRMIYAVKDFKL